MWLPRARLASDSQVTRSRLSEACPHTKQRCDLSQQSDTSTESVIQCCFGQEHAATDGLLHKVWLPKPSLNSLTLGLVILENVLPALFFEDRWLLPGIKTYWLHSTLCLT